MITEEDIASEADAELPPSLRNGTQLHSTNFQYKYTYFKIIYCTVFLFFDDFRRERGGCSNKTEF